MAAVRYFEVISDTFRISLHLSRKFLPIIIVIIQLFIFLHAYSTAQRPIIKGSTSKRRKENKHAHKQWTKIAITVGIIIFTIAIKKILPTRA
jgi:uncharacterized membrane protein